MYNFRYHLSTIVAIFISLAVGLVLGAAIAGSDLVRNTSNDLVDSLVTRFDELSQENKQLQSRLDDESMLATDYIVQWADKRLDGRTVVVLSSAQDARSDSYVSLRNTLRLGNASIVDVVVNRQSFGIEDQQTRTLLEGIVVPVEGERYQETLARALADEWTYSYVPTSSDWPLAADYEAVQNPEAYWSAQALAAEEAAAGLASSPAEPSAPDAPDAPDATGEPGTEDAQGGSGTGEGEGAGDGAGGGTSATGGTDTKVGAGLTGIVPLTAFQKTFYAHYPLTLTLIKQGIITVQTDYQPLIDHQSPVPSSEQTAILRLAALWKVPYGANGFVDTLAEPSYQSGPLGANETGILIASAFNVKGEAGLLPYPSWLKESVRQQAAQGAEIPRVASYYSLVVLLDGYYQSLAYAAQERSLSCETVPEDVCGKYSIVALLSGATKGIYGTDRPSTEMRFPDLPTDKTGRLPFAS
ncbi:MAG: copper transporter [Coriobacteriales bacterium]|jgi:hypothetical protein|nr:copper transporter [Coriobacteriales bacterium]